MDRAGRDDGTARFLASVWEPCGNRACDGGLARHCLRDAPLWTVYAATGERRSEALGMRQSLINGDEGSLELGWVVVEEGNSYRLRKLTKDGDANAVIYVDQPVINVLKWQRERQDAERKRLGSAWADQDLVFARDGFKLYRGRGGRAAGPREGLGALAHPTEPAAPARGLPDSRLEAQQVTNGLEAGENPGEVSANVRYHSPGCTMARYGHSRKNGARKLAASGASRLGLSSLA